MTRRVKLLAVAMIVVSVMVLTGIFFCCDGRPNKTPKYRVGQVVERRFGDSEGIVMEVKPGRDTVKYKVKFYYKIDSHVLRYPENESLVLEYKEFELCLPR